MKRTAKWLTTVLSLAIVTNSMAVYSVGDAVLPSQTSHPSQIEETASDTVEVSPAFAAAAGEEILEWREEGVRHYYLGDGRYQAIVAAESTVQDGDAATASTSFNGSVFLDSYITSSNPNGFYGNSSQLTVGTIQTAYMKCDLPELPSNATIENAELHFWYKYNITTGSLTMKAYLVNFPWDESDLNWTKANSYPNLGMDTYWSESISLPAVTTPTPTHVSISITEAAQRWKMDGIQPNYGIAFKRVSGSNNSVLLMSSEASSAYRPYAVITYSLDELPVENGSYYLRSGKHLSYFARRDRSNSCVIDTYSSESSCKWEFQYLHNGYYAIQNTYNNKALAVAPGFDTTAGEELVVESFVGDPRQQWSITPTANGLFKISPRCAESHTANLAMCLMTPNNSQYDPRYLDIVQDSYTFDSILADEWLIQPINQAPAITYQTQIFYDVNFGQQFTDDQIRSIYQEAVAPFETMFGVKFQTPCYSGHSEKLDIGSGCDTGDDLDDICNDICGEYAQCYSSHHKSATRFLNAHSSITYHNCSLVYHAMCYYDSEDQSHGKVAGMAYPEEPYFVASYKADNFTKTIQHEISHTLGTNDNDCTPGQPCVTQNDTEHYLDEENYWCDNCVADILRYVAENNVSNTVN